MESAGKSSSETEENVLMLLSEIEQLELERDALEKSLSRISKNLLTRRLKTLGCLRFRPKYPNLSSNPEKISILWQISRRKKTRFALSLNLL